MSLWFSSHESGNSQDYQPAAINNDWICSMCKIKNKNNNNNKNWGSIKNVMNGKHFIQARYVIMTSLEALELLLLFSFQKKERSDNAWGCHRISVRSCQGSKQGECDSSQEEQRMEAMEIELWNLQGKGVLSWKRQNSPVLVGFHEKGLAPYEISKDYKRKQLDFSVRKGKIAQFWLSFMKKDWLLMRFLRTTKENNLTFQLEKAK